MKAMVFVAGLRGTGEARGRTRAMGKEEVRRREEKRGIMYYIYI
jgi:hypothetical protein